MGKRKRVEESDKDNGKFVQEGEVVEALPNATFKVRMGNSDTYILAHVSGKIRKNNIRIYTGDLVAVELDGYDLTKGRIVYRNS